MRRFLTVLASTTLLATAALTAGHSSTPTFGPPVKVPGSGGGSEPGINLSSNGTIFVDAPTGLPGHSALWKSTDGGTSYKSVSFGSPWSRLPGGGDSDVVTKGNKVWFLDLSAASNSISISENNAETFSIGSPLTSLPASDRQWIGLGDPDPTTGLDTVYILYALIQQPSQVMLAKSIDGGVTWPLHSMVPAYGAAKNFTSQLEVQGSSLAFAWEDRNVLSVATSADGGTTWSTTEVHPLVYGSIIPGFAMDGDTIAVSFMTWDLRVHVAVSTDGGKTFGEPTAVSTPGTTNMFPWVDVEDDKVAVAWYGTTSLNAEGEPNDPNDVRADEEWFVRYAESLDAGATWSDQVSVTTAKKGFICTKGLGCPNLGVGGRELGDFLTLTIRHDDLRSMIAYGGRVPGGIKVVTQN